MTVTQKPAALAQPRRRLLWPAATSAGAEGTAAAAGSSAAPNVAASAPQAASPGTEHCRRTARKANPHAGSCSADSASVMAATDCQPRHQENAISRENAAPGLRHMPGQAGHASLQQGPSAAGTTSASGHHQTPTFDLRAALRRDASGQAMSNAARPDQHAQLAAPGSTLHAARGVPLGVAQQQVRTHVDAQRQGSAQQAVAGQPGAPVQAGASSAPLPAQEQGQSVPAKRAAGPGLEPPAKRAKRGDGSLLGIANCIIRDFARRRLGATASPMPVCLIS